MTGVKVSKCQVSGVKVSGVRCQVSGGVCWSRYRCQWERLLEAVGLVFRSTTFRTKKNRPVAWSGVMLDLGLSLHLVYKHKRPSQVWEGLLFLLRLTKLKV